MHQIRFHLENSYQGLRSMLLTSHEDREEARKVLVLMLNSIRTHEAIRQYDIRSLHLLLSCVQCTFPSLHQKQLPFSPLHNFLPSLQRYWCREKQWFPNIRTIPHYVLKKDYLEIYISLYT
ncbi:hypothetical protein TNCT_336921 [Trichonephila clavata]|uniref:Uncharacterized protein n=1 Tax=Trichonephila clavata TaxID=2740835 RepID=A0A8X6L6Y7_TRICU|nr:hypothetical protein TNCT_336921 [Trichonephila clavata]